MRNSDYSVMIDPAQASRHISDEVFLEAQELLSEDSDALENPEILAALNAEVMNRFCMREMSRQQVLFLTASRISVQRISHGI